MSILITIGSVILSASMLVFGIATLEDLSSQMCRPDIPIPLCHTNYQLTVFQWIGVGFGVLVSGIAVLLIAAKTDKTVIDNVPEESKEEHHEDERLGLPLGVWYSIAMGGGFAGMFIIPFKDIAEPFKSTGFVMLWVPCFIVLGYQIAIAIRRRLNKAT